MFNPLYPYVDTRTIRYKLGANRWRELHNKYKNVVVVNPSINPFYWCGQEWENIYFTHIAPVFIEFYRLLEKYWWKIEYRKGRIDELEDITDLFVSDFQMCIRKPFKKFIIVDRIPLGLVDAFVSFEDCEVTSTNYEWVQLAGINIANESDGWRIVDTSSFPKTGGNVRK